MLYIVLFILVVGIVVLTLYNSLVNKKNRIEAAELELAKYEESGDERDIDNAKKYYNAVVKEYNNAVEHFPTSIIADTFNFPRMHTESFDDE